jgi:hypothetical protein
MYARNVNAAQLKEVAGKFQFSLDYDVQGNRVRFTLINMRDDGKYAVVNPGLSGSSRRFTSKVCYHGHYDFFRALFAEYPDAIVDAGYYQRVRYEMPNWEAEASELGNLVVREWDQLRVRDKCECESDN